ncbi:hypothetical protein ACFW1A_37585 [Kitasatospora sp. NPDC058965]|uniref:hypothetical protein n=1 Tax=Kitasatospora sp. NPDC058965 TaxID=3346682 RepID=UPI00368A55B8
MFVTHSDLVGFDPVRFDAAVVAASTPDAGEPLRGDFEVHLTVGAAVADELAVWSAEHGLKFTHILLDRGAAVSQPMLTLRESGSFEEVAAVTRRMAGRLAGAGFAVLRVKIEAVPWAEGVPQSDADGARHGAHRYFEHHVKLLLAEDESTDGLAELAVRHGAHLSRNARRVRADGLRERFVTQRCRLVGLATAGLRLDALLAELAADGRRTASAEREFVALDTDETLDAGWIDEYPTAEHRNIAEHRTTARHIPAHHLTAHHTTAHDRQGALR